MKRHQWHRAFVPDTRLARAIDARDRYREYCMLKQPSAAPGVQWAIWRDWSDARRDYINAEIKAATAEKRRNQRRKADERKLTPPSRV